VTANMMGRAKDNGRSAGEQRRPRRELLAGAAAALGVVTVETLANAGPAHAAQGSAVILGQDNTGATASTGVFDTGGESAVLADPATHTGVAGTGGGNGPGVRGQGAGFGSGVLGFGGANDGTGVTGTADGNGTGVIGNGHGFGSGVVGNGGGGDAHGVEGFGSGTGSGAVGRGGAGGGAGLVGSALGNGTGVVGIGAGSGAGVEGIGGAGGVGVLAESSAGGTALKATGRVVFSKSGVLTVAAGSSKVTKTGVALTPASLVLATLQQDVPGVWVRSAVPNVTAKSFTVHPSKAVSAKTKVAWFVLN
jgi:hypothetical protein